MARIRLDDRFAGISEQIGLPLYRKNGARGKRSVHTIAKKEVFGFLKECFSFL